MKFTLKENLNTIYYTLYPSWDGSGEIEWEYEPTLFDEKRFTDAIMKTYDKDTLEEILKDVLFDDYFDLPIEEQLEELKDLVFENIDLFDEDAYDFFYEDAVEQYEEQSSYGSDNGSGMSDRDF